MSHYMDSVPHEPEQAIQEDARDGRRPHESPVRLMVDLVETLDVVPRPRGPYKTHSRLAA